MKPHVERMLREPEVRSMTGLSHATLWRLERAGSFPKRVKLSTNAVGWPQGAIEAWVEARSGRAPSETRSVVSSAQLDGLEARLAIAEAELSTLRRFMHQIAAAAANVRTAPLTRRSRGGEASLNSPGGTSR